MYKIRFYLKMLEMVALTAMLTGAAYLVFGLWTYFSPVSAPFHD